MVYNSITRQGDLRFDSLALLGKIVLLSYYAQVVELVDRSDLESEALKSVQVRVLS